MNLFKNPLVKIIGIVAIMYFALFANKNNPQSLGNRLSSERIKKNLSEMQEKGKFIASNVQAAKSYVKVREEEIKNNGGAVDSMPQIVEIVKDIDLGIGKAQVICGSEVAAFVSLNSDKARNIDLKPDAKFVIGSKKNWLLEKNIIGMKKGGVREIKVPQGFKSGDAELSRVMQENNSDLTYQIILKEITKNPTPESKVSCE